MLVYANMAIDAVQNAKKSFLTTFVKEDSIRKPLEEFVEVQGSFARQVARTNWELAEAMMAATNKVLNNTGLRKTTETK